MRALDQRRAATPAAGSGCARRCRRSPLRPRSAASCAKCSGPRSSKRAGPVEALAARADDDAVRDLFAADADPARAVAADGLDVGLVGLQLHGARCGCLLRCTEAAAELWSNYRFSPVSNRPAGGALKTVHKSAKLANVLYDIRGPVMDAARQMEEEGHKIIKLNIGNLAAFGFDAPDEILQDMIRNLPNSAGYSDQQGHVRARARRSCTTRSRRASRASTLDDIYLGNGASRTDRDGHATRCSTTATKCCCRRPTIRCGRPRVSLSGGTPVHYLCDEANGWMPDLDDIRAQDHAAHQGASSSSTRTTRPARCTPDELLQRDRRDRAPARPGRSSPTRSTTRSLYDGETHTVDRQRWPTTC